jgi:glutaminyl-peptide cyclotransferase
MKKYFIAATLLIFAACKNNTNKNIDTSTINPDPPSITYIVAKIYPHDTTTYTEGLEWHDGYLYESGGDPDYKGRSSLSKIDLQTGKAVQQIKLGKEYFGEGITMLNGKIYQMTWREHKCFVYDAKTFKLLNTFTYDGEGWGMTNDGKNIIMDDGSNHLYYRDPETFNVIKTISVSDNYGPEASVNELEYVNGFIYANVYMENFLIKINPLTGNVVGRIDLKNIREKNGVASDPNMANDGYVLNGIAYDPAKNSFYVTGKNWPALFEIKLN